MNNLAMRIDRLEAASRESKRHRVPVEVVDAFIAHIRDIAAGHLLSESEVTTEAAALMTSWKTEWRALSLKAI